MAKEVKEEVRIDKWMWAVRLFKTRTLAAEACQNVVKSGRNIPGCEVTFANLLNVYDIVNAKKLVLDKAALQKIEEVFA